MIFQFIILLGILTTINSKCLSLKKLDDIEAGRVELFVNGNNNESYFQPIQHNFIIIPQIAISIHQSVT